MKIITFVLIIVALRESTGIKITELSVPSTLNADLVDHVILDCVYEVDKTLGYQLDVKWYFNNNPSPFYIWIPGYKPGVLPIEPFQSSVDLSTSHIDDKEANKLNQHRAIKILRPGPSHSGLYTCKTSTFVGEDRASASMIVYGLPERSYMNVSVDPVHPQFLDVECQFLRVFPKPKVSLEWTSSNFSGSISGGMNSYIFPNEKVKDAFDIEIFHQIEMEESFPGEDIINFECSLTILEVDQKMLLSYEFEQHKEKEDNDEEESGSGMDVEQSGESGDHIEEISGDEVMSGSGLNEFSGDNLSGYFSGEELSGEEDESSGSSCDTILEGSSEYCSSGMDSSAEEFSGDEDESSGSACDTILDGSSEYCSSGMEGSAEEFSGQSSVDLDDPDNNINLEESEEYITRRRDVEILQEEIALSLENKMPNKDELDSQQASNSNFLIKPETKDPMNLRPSVTSSSKNPCGLHFSLQFLTILTLYR